MNYKPQDAKNILLSIINRQKENLTGLVVNPPKKIFLEIERFHMRR